jgi:hypothetical protein
MSDTITIGPAIGDIVYTGTSAVINTGAGMSPLTMTGASGTISSSSLGFGTFDMEDFLDTHTFNKITVEHKVQEQELMKLKETVPTYADEIKENLSKNLARDIIKKTTFTKKHNKDADVHHFLGRVWVFTEDELKNLINEARNA